MLKIRKVKRPLAIMQIGDNLVEDQVRIKNRILNFYQNLFSDRRCAPTNFSIIKDIISEQVTNNDNNMLTTIPTNEEVHAAIFSLDSSIAPGPGGYSGAFYPKCWDIVGKKVISTVWSFFITGHVHHNLNSNFIVVIPKIKDALLIDTFRRIVLGKFLFKIITMIIADGLGKMA